MNLLDIANAAMEEYERQDRAAYRWRVVHGHREFELLVLPEQTKAGVLALYPGAAVERLPDQIPPPSRKEEVAVDDVDDRRPCSSCGELNSKGLCMSALRGERPRGAAKGYSPAINIPWRCERYKPRPNDRDQRSADERWPIFCASQRVATKATEATKASGTVTP